ncbi:MAG: AbrB/MazE/SpoVT family DNA-binding domain-containing protein [Halobacteriota archaeon]
MFYIGLFAFDMIVKGVAAMVVLSATVRMICDGRVTIPLEIREVEGIKEGDYIKITVEKVENPANPT